MAAIGVLGVWAAVPTRSPRSPPPSRSPWSSAFAIGIAAAARSERLERTLRPSSTSSRRCRSSSTLIPVVALFGVGRAPAVAAAVVWRRTARRHPHHHAGPAPGRPGPRWRQPAPWAPPAASSCARSNSRLARPALLLASQPGRRLVLAVDISGLVRRLDALGFTSSSASPRATSPPGLVAGAAIVCLGRCWTG